MFNIGEYVVYGNVGVCEVEEICTPEFMEASEDKLYYVLKALYANSGTIYTPVENPKVMMRAIIGKEDVDTLIESIPSIEVEWISNDRRRTEIYRDAIRSCDCDGLMKVIKNLYARKQERVAVGKRLSLVDERQLSSAVEFLHGELAVALGLDLEEVEDYIAAQVS